MGNMENLTPYQQSKKLRRQAVWWLVIPTIVLVIVLALYAIMTFVMVQTLSSVTVEPFGVNVANAQETTEPAAGADATGTIQLGQPDDQPLQFGENPFDSGPADSPTPTLYQDFDFGDANQPFQLGKPTAASGLVAAMAMLMGLLGLISVILIPVGIIVGVVKVMKANNLPITNYDQRSGKGPSSEYPAEIKGWSWGAFGLGLYWTIYHGAWLGLLMLVPYLNIIWMFVMGAKGKKWAWANMKWESVEDYLAVQKKWDKWGLIVFIISMVILVLAIIAFVTLFSALLGASNAAQGLYQVPVK